MILGRIQCSFYVPTEVTIDLKLTEYIVEEDSARVEVCVVVTGAETSTLSVYVCTEQDTAKGIIVNAQKVPDSKFIRIKK